MFKRGIYCAVLALLMSIVLTETRSVLACEICTIPRLGRQEKLVGGNNPDKKWYFEYLFEEQNWNELDPAYVHGLHHAGHHAHDKTKEYFHHFTFGRHFSDDVSIAVEMPYVVKHSLGVEHATLGNKETSEGIGDANLIASYHALVQEKSAFSMVGGIKFPTGKTDEVDTAGNEFEIELQPGSGSFDFLLGGIFELQLGRFIVKGNTTYSFKNEGKQDFEYGDLLSTSFFVDYVLNANSVDVKAKAGVDINYQYAQKDEEGGVEVSDSGGQTIMMGPTITVDGFKNISLFGNILFPVMQDLGGVHQELDYVWTAGGKILW
jgi:hypothetical protein